mgnify:CR=1 FL=1
MQRKNVSFILICAALLGMLLGLTGCNPVEYTPEPGKVSVMATTSVVGDVVQQIGGEYVQVELLLPLGTDPHSFTPTPQDITRLAAARLGVHLPAGRLQHPHFWPARAGRNPTAVVSLRL